MNINDSEGLTIGMLPNTAASIVNPTSKVLSTDVDGKIILVDTSSISLNSIHPTIEGLTEFSTSGTHHNVALPSSNGYRYTGDDDVTWTGLVAGAVGQKITIWNPTDYMLHLQYEHASSIATNRFRRWGMYDAIMPSNCVVVLQYSSVFSRWVCVSLTMMGST